MLTNMAIYCIPVSSACTGTIPCTISKYLTTSITLYEAIYFTSFSVINLYCYDKFHVVSINGLNMGTEQTGITVFVCIMKTVPKITLAATLSTTRKYVNTFLFQSWIFTEYSRHVNKYVWSWRQLLWIYSTHYFLPRWDQGCDMFRKFSPAPVWIHNSLRGFKLSTVTFTR